MPSGMPKLPSKHVHAGRHTDCHGHPTFSHAIRHATNKLVPSAAESTGTRSRLLAVIRFAHIACFPSFGVRLWLVANQAKAHKRAQTRARKVLRNVSPSATSQTRAHNHIQPIRFLMAGNIPSSNRPVAHSFIGK